MPVDLTFPKMEGQEWKLHAKALRLKRLQSEIVQTKDECLRIRAHFRFFLEHGSITFN